MKGFRATRSGISATFDAQEAGLLADLATQVATLITGRGDGAGDPVLRRLFPAAYRDDEQNAEEFRRFTEEELADDKVGNALSIASTLTTPARDGAKDDRVRVTLDDAAAFAWLRSLTDIRLALATRLGIETEESVPPTDDESRYTFAVYSWLGELQYSLVRAVDR
ncbi:MAG: DUF2017 family protein [Galbitalea sp.]